MKAGGADQDRGGRWERAEAGSGRWTTRQSECSWESALGPADGCVPTGMGREDSRVPVVAGIQPSSERLLRNLHLAQTRLQDPSSYNAKR